MGQLAPLDWIVMAAYAAVVLGIGWFAHRRQRDPEDYFLGGRRLRWWVVGVSLVATSFSSVSLIGGTAFGFHKGLGYLQWQIGDLLALIAVMFVFLPFFSSLRLTTAYEYLERRFGVVARSVASALFIGQTCLRAAILVYGPALALSEILDWSIEISIITSAAAAIVYSAFGGLGAVVWTDLLQMLVIVFAVSFCIVLVVGDVPGGCGAVFDHAYDHDRLEAVTFEADLKNPVNILGTLVPYFVLAFALFGTGQQAVQRFLSVRDLRSARRAAVLGWTMGTVSLVITLSLGVCIAAWVDLAPTAADFAMKEKESVLPAFVRLRLPAGLAGLMLAAIFAASMSSLDSAIHSMSTAGIVDFLRRFSQRPPSPRAELLTARFATAGFGIVAILGALYAAGESKEILTTLVTWLGYFAGPLLGLFLLGVLTTRTEQVGALVGTGVAFLAVVIAVLTDALAGVAHPLWLAPASCLTTLVVGTLVSLLRPAPPGEKLAGLTLFTRKGPRA